MFFYFKPYKLYHKRYVKSTQKMIFSNNIFNEVRRVRIFVPAALLFYANASFFAAARI